MLSITVFASWAAWPVCDPLCIVRSNQVCEELGVNLG